MPEAVKPSEVKTKPRKERSTPVRNPAFRESEPLKALQRQLHADARKK